MDKRPEVNTAQDELLNLQRSLSQETKTADRITVILFVVLIFALAALMIILPDREFSEQENRYLQKQPEFTVKNLIDGSYTGKVGDYFADQFPFRDAFVAIKGAAEIAQGKRENNSVTLASDGYIIKRGGYPDYETADKNLSGIIAFADGAGRLGIPYVVAIAGRGEDVLRDKQPALYPRDIQDKAYEYLRDNLDSVENLKYLDLRAPFAADESGEQLYYKTDHHWTSRGALMGANLILKELGAETHDYSYYSPETASDAFYGTTWSSGGMKWVKPDTIEFFRFEGDEEFVTHIDDTGVEYKGFYDRAYLEKKDKYSSFIGGNNARVDIYKVDETGARVERPKLVLLKDSFAHSAAPFLAQSYDLILIDLRYYKDSVFKLCKEESVSAVAVLVNFDSLESSSTFGLLKMGL
ncbi:MAG: DHHW family protein [Eubacteriales bacterium]|jgi:alginate O-acetyltransferase complex protein AlgJ